MHNGLWLTRVHRFSQKLLAETTACPKRTTAMKADTSLFLLAEARVRTKLISCHISQASHIHGFKELAIFMGSSDASELS